MKSINLSKINFLVTFDDGSSTVLKIVPYLREKSIPYAICLSTEVLEKGYGIRDKVYMIINNIDENKLFDFVEQKIYIFDAPSLEPCFYNVFRMRVFGCSFKNKRICHFGPFKT